MSSQNNLEQSTSQTGSFQNGPTTPITKSPECQIKLPSKYSQADENGKFILQWKDVNFTIRNGHSQSLFKSVSGLFTSQSSNRDVTNDIQILKNSNGLIKSGELVAIIGPSGSGKTTLLNILSRRYNKHHHQEFAINGKVLLNNHEMSRQHFMDIGGFLEQDDIFWESYTPRELIMEAGELRTSMNHDELEEQTDKLIKQLNLGECKNSIVGGKFIPPISGGERKRTSFAIEMITNPILVLLDEPTSGLDSENAMRLIQLLKRQTTERHCSIICTLHQPSSGLFKLFDHVICLSEGHTIYNGPVPGIKSYFKKCFNLSLPPFTNPSDYLIKLAIQPSLVSSDLTTEQLVQACQSEHIQYLKLESDYITTFKKDDIKGIKTIRSTTFKKQFKVLLRRSFVGFFRVPMVLFAVFGLGIFATFLIASIYYQTGAFQLGFDMSHNKTAIKDWLGLAFYMANDIFAWGMMSQVVQIPTRIQLFRKERLAGLYTAHSFYFALWVGQGIMLFMYPVMVSLGTFYFLGFKDQSLSNYWEFIKTCVLVSQVGSNFGFMWGSVFIHDENSTVVSALVYLMISALGAGQIVNLQTPSPIVKIISAISPARYAVERIYRRVVSQQTFEVVLLNIFGFTLGDDECAKILMFMSALFFLLGWAFLVYRSSRL